MKKTFVLLAVCTFLGSGSALAQKAEEPEDCILKTIQVAAKEHAHVIRFNCTRKYLKAVEGRTSVVPLSLTSQAMAYWVPRASTVGYPYFIESQFKVELKNNSMFRLIYAVVHIINKESKSTETYKIYADEPIEPFSVGSFTTSVKVDDKITTHTEFWDKYGWVIQSVSGITK